MPKILLLQFYMELFYILIMPFNGGLTVEVRERTCLPFVETFSISKTSPSSQEHSFSSLCDENCCPYTAHISNVNCTNKNIRALIRMLLQFISVNKWDPSGPFTYMD